VPPNLFGQNGGILQLDVFSGFTRYGQNPLDGFLAEQRQGQTRNHAIRILYVPLAVACIIIDDVQSRIPDLLEAPAEIPIDLETGQTAVLRQLLKDFPGNGSGTRSELDHPPASPDLLSHPPGQHPTALRKCPTLLRVSEKLPGETQTHHITASIHKSDLS
jgi:hypothetical protein